MKDDQWIFATNQLINMNHVKNMVVVKEQKPWDGNSFQGPFCLKKQSGNEMQSCKRIFINIQA